MYLCIEFIYVKKSVGCSQATKLGFGVFLDFISGKDINVCMWGVMSSMDHPNRLGSRGSLGCCPRGLFGGFQLDPHQFVGGAESNTPDIAIMFKQT